MKLKMLNKGKGDVSFLLEKSSPAYANTIRRIAMGEVPVMAIEEINFKKNSSSLYDEIIAHRLGLIVLSTDLKSYEIPVSQEEIEERKAKSTLILKLKAKSPGIVYASNIKSKDPKVVPVYPKTPIVKLLKDQELEFEAVAVLGQGKNHAKWSPGHVYYTFNPIIKVNNKSKSFEEFKNQYPKEIFNKKGEIDKDLIIKNNLTDACQGVCEDIVKIEYDKESYIFHIESWGHLKPKEIMLKSIEILNDKLDEFTSLTKKAK